MIATNIAKKTTDYLQGFKNFLVFRIKLIVDNEF